MEDYYKIKESSYLMYHYAKNLYGWAMSQKLHVDNINTIQDREGQNVPPTSFSPATFTK